MAEHTHDDDQLLAKILAAHGRDASTLESLLNQDVQAVRAVAERRRGEPFSFNPVTIELVRAVLVDTLEAGPRGKQAWGHVAEQVAKSLYDNPAANARLAAMWTRLSLSGAEG